MTAAPLHWEVDFQTVDGMFIKQISIPRRGTLLPQHIHKYDHSTLLVKGKIILWRGPKGGIRQCSLHVAPEILQISANCWHEFQTQTDDCLLFCLHNLKGAAGVELIEEHDLSFEDLGFER